MSIKCLINDQREAQSSRTGFKRPSARLEEVFSQTKFLFKLVVFGGTKKGELGSEREER